MKTYFGAVATATLAMAFAFTPQVGSAQIGYTTGGNSHYRHSRNRTSSNYGSSSSNGSYKGITMSTGGRNPYYYRNNYGNYGNYNNYNSYGYYGNSYDYGYSPYYNPYYNSGSYTRMYYNPPQ